MIYFITIIGKILLLIQSVTDIECHCIGAQTVGSEQNLISLGFKFDPLIISFSTGHLNLMNTAIFVILVPVVPLEGEDSYFLSLFTSPTSMFVF